MTPERQIAALALADVTRDRSRRRGRRARSTAPRETFAVGQWAFWMHELRRGYGYTYAVPVVIKTIGPRFARVQAYHLRDGVKVVRVTVNALRSEMPQRKAA